MFLERLLSKIKHVTPSMKKLLYTDILVQELPEMSTWWLFVWTFIILDCQIIQFPLRIYFFR